MPNLIDILSSKDIARFWSYVSKSGDCWLWLGGLSKGYGNFKKKVNGVAINYKAHQLSWELCVGKIPPESNCLHKCNNRNCCNPSHLYLGSQGDNNMDRARTSPLSQGGRVSKLTDSNILEIKRLKDKKIKYSEIAKLFGVSTSYISNIVNDNKHYSYHRTQP